MLRGSRRARSSELRRLIGAIRRDDQPLPRREVVRALALLSAGLDELEAGFASLSTDPPEAGSTD